MWRKCLCQTKMTGKFFLGHKTKNPKMFWWGLTGRAKEEILKLTSLRQVFATRWPWRQGRPPPDSRTLPRAVEVGSLRICSRHKSEDPQTSGLLQQSDALVDRSTTGLRRRPWIPSAPQKYVMKWEIRKKGNQIRNRTFWLSYHFRAGHFRLDSFERPFLAITNSCIGLSSTRFLSLSQKAEQLQRRGEVLEGIQALNPRARCVLSQNHVNANQKNHRTSAFWWDVMCCSQNIPYWQPATGAAEHGECVSPFLELHWKMQTNRSVRNRETWIKKWEEAKKLTIHKRMLVRFGDGDGGFQ